MTPFSQPVHQPARLGDGPDRAVVVHGFPGTPAETRAVGESLAGRGWRVFLPCLPGFGRDYPNLERTSWSAWQAATTDVLRSECRKARASGGRFLAVGFSVGGALSLCSVVEDGVEVDGLVLLAPFTRFDHPLAGLLPIVKHVVRRYRPYAKADLDDPAVREGITRKIGDVDLDDPEVRERLRRDVSVPVCSLDDVRRLGRHALRVAPALRGVRTLVVQGRRDPTVLPHTTDELVARLGEVPQAVWIEDADHLFVLAGRPGHGVALSALARFSESVRRGVKAPRHRGEGRVDARRSG
jgi:pimeloyl-ACP methyl ester carboxylesterase